MIPEIPKIPFLGLPLAALTTGQYLEILLAAARARAAPFTAAYLNAATVNLAFDAPDYAAALRRMDCLYADGQAVVWAARWRGTPVPERINAGDFSREVIGALATGGLKLALVGGRPGEARRAGEVFQSWAPGLRLVFVQHGFFSATEAAGVCAALERADPDLVLLGMGSPRQEFLGLEWAAAGRPRAWWCVGALFEYCAGARARAPRWMRRAGLEWAFRLALEPARLWKRYLIGNPRFVWRVLKRRAVGK